VRRALPVLLCALWPVAAVADPPVVDHQPSPCTVPDKPISLCATISADADRNVGAARVFFRPMGDKYWSTVDMTFTGISFCGTLPAPRAGKVQTVEYYVQATDDTFESQRTSTFQLAVQSEDQCGFPPVEKDAERAGKISVHATNAKQGKKLADQFDPTGVTFVPSAAK
jgi:hypothetical protein